MSIFRLLPFSLVIAAGVATLSAQSLPDKINAAIQPSDSQQLNFSAISDLLSLNLTPELNPPNPQDRILIGDYRPRLNEFSVPRFWLHTKPDDSQADIFCLKMRVYKVARDGPDTDSMHPVGYTTCSPAARLQTHSAEFKVVPATP